MLYDWSGFYQETPSVLFLLPLFVCSPLLSNLLCWVLKQQEAATNVNTILNLYTVYLHNFVASLVVGFLGKTLKSYFSRISGSHILTSR